MKCFSDLDLLGICGPCDLRQNTAFLKEQLQKTSRILQSHLHFDISSKFI